MASRAQIERLAQRIDVLVGRAQAKIPRRVVTFIQHIGETEEQAKRQHLEANPADKDAPLFIVIKVCRATGLQRDLASNRKGGGFEGRRIGFWCQMLIGRRHVYRASKHRFCRTQVVLPLNGRCRATGHG